MVPKNWHCLHTYERDFPSLFCTLCLDDEEALNSIMNDLAALGRCYNQQISHKPKIRTLLFKQVRHTLHYVTNDIFLEVIWMFFFSRYKIHLSLNEGCEEVCC